MPCGRRADPTSADHQVPVFNIRKSLVLVLTAVSAASAAGCGEDASQTADKPTASTPPAATSTPAASTPKEPAAKPTVDPAIARDKRRGKSLLKSYGADGRSRWLIKSVTVEGGAVTVKTGLFPKSDNEPQFTGACSTFMDWEDWMESIEVLGSDGEPHATWQKGDAFCNVSV